MPTRTELVTELINNPKMSAASLEQLHAYGWDSESPLATVGKADILEILHCFKCGELTAEEIQAWANRVEGRDDIEYENGSDGPVSEAIFLLANPAINFPINPALCQRIENLFQASRGQSK